jgi:hypothetical protein
MAYLDLSRSPFELPAVSAGTAPAEIQDAPLNDVERTVLALSLKDPLWSIGPESRLGHLLRWIFDYRRPTSLANDRLEALHRFAVLSRRFGDQLDRSESDRLSDAGYSPRLIRDALATLISNPRTSAVRAAR